MDLIDFQFAYDMAVVERVDKGELSEAEGTLLSAELRTRITSEEKRRNMLAQQAQAQRDQAWQNSIRMLNDNLQRQQDRDALMFQQQQPLAPTTCYTQYLGNGQTSIQCF